MVDKKQKEAVIKRTKQVLVVGACVLFVVLMILSGMGSHWLTMFTVVKPGDTVVLDYTFYDATGDPLLTSNQQTYLQAEAAGRTVVYGRQLSVVAGQSLTRSLFPVPIYLGSSGGWTGQFALFSSEYDTIARSLVGLKTGDVKRIAIPNGSVQQQWPKEQLSRRNVSMDELSVGDLLAMGVSDNPEEMATNSSAEVYTRLGEITIKTADGVIVDSGFPSADISVVAINPQRS